MIGGYLLSDELWVVGCLHLEGAVVGPQIDRVGDACAAAFVDLDLISTCTVDADSSMNAHHFGRLGPGNVELHVRVLLPVAEEEGEPMEKPVERIAKAGEGLGARVSVETTLECFARLDERLPSLEVVGVRLHLLLEFAYSRVLLVTSVVAKVAHGCGRK
jgi:hypothetical protein